MGAPENKKCTIIGAGLAGSLQALYMARRGMDVQIFERRTDSRKEPAWEGRSINLALSTRGLTALKEVGVDQDVLKDSVPMYGRVLHDLEGNTTYTPYGTGDQQITSVDRRRLNEVLMSAAEAHPNVKIHFSHKCTSIDVEQGKVTFVGPMGRVEIDDGIIFGCDGAYSVVRQAMQKTHRFQYAQEYLSHGYKELTIPPTKDGEYALDVSEGLHIWPRGDYMMIALPNADKSFTMTLFFRHNSENPDQNSFADIKCDQDILDFFEKQFGDCVPVMPTLVRDYNRNPVGPLVTIKCAPHHIGDKVCLIGDASHAICPFYGQGCNAAFEDCRVLNELFTEYNGDTSKIFPAYTASRKPNTDAIADLALENFIEMRDKVGGKVFRAKWAIGQFLHKLSPRLYTPLYPMISFSNVDYDEARKRVIWQDAMVDNIFKGVGGATALALVGAAGVFGARYMQAKK